MTNIQNNTHETSTERRILEAAEEEFLRKGFANARTTAIAEAAGVTHAMLHYYFRTKEKLFSKVIHEKISALAETFVVKVDDDVPLSDSIRRAVESHFDFVRANPLLPRFFVTEVFANETLLDILKEKLRTIADSNIAALQSKINSEAAAGRCRPVDAFSIFMDIVSLNVFPILAAPLARKLRSISSDKEFDAFLDARREENVKTILSRLYA